MVEPNVYDPLDYGNLTMNLVRELMTREPKPLPLAERFSGPGVYALFYNGNFEPYSVIRSPSADQPIYVGKAVPPGARKGGIELDRANRALHNRIREHVASINGVGNLQVEDFCCRYLVVVPLWIIMAERFLIDHYQPCWNTCLEGFGPHDPGKGRYQGEKSWWDTLHPGRSWASKLQSVKSRQEALERLRSFLEARSGPGY